MSPFYRQNDREALEYLKASYYCMSRERNAKYFLIIISFFVCICGIMNKYLPNMFTSVSNIVTIQNELTTYINLVSGLVIIINMVMGFYTYRMHLEGVVLQEHYDCYVFDCPKNVGMMRSISPSVIKIYASKARKKDEYFYNFYFETLSDVDDKTALYDYQNKQLRDDHRLYMSVQSFFLFVWIGFCICIFVIALSFDDRFINTLINILFPSMSAITMICNSWFNFRQQIKQLNNAIVVVDKIQSLPDKERTAAMTDKLNLRMIQTSLFNFRASPFVIPTFLVKNYRKQLEKENYLYIPRRSSDLIIAGSEKNIRTKYRAATQTLAEKGVIKLNKSNKNVEPEIKTLCLPPVETKAEPPTLKFDAPQNMEVMDRNKPKRESKNLSVAATMQVKPAEPRTKIAERQKLPIPKTENAANKEKTVALSPNAKNKTIATPPSAKEKTIAASQNVKEKTTAVSPPIKKNKK